MDATSFPPQLHAFMEVSQKARDLGLMARTYRFYLVLGICLAFGFLGCVSAVIALGDTWFQLIIAVVMGVIFTQVAFLAHEAGHRQILRRGPAGATLARWLAGVIGMSYEWWESKHARHHGNPNRVGKDPDIAPGVISFVAEDAANARGLPRWIARRQGWLFFPLLTLEGLNLHAQSVRHLVSRGAVRHRWTELAIVLLRTAALCTLLLLCMSPLTALVFVIVQLAVFGVYMGGSFAPNHKGMPVVEQKARLDFFSKQVRTSRNIRGGWWMTALMGGLNHQVEHHLFPSMARPHLSRAREIVREHCRAIGVPYTETSLVTSYAMVVRYLNEVGIAARDPFECPLLAQRGGAGPR